MTQEELATRLSAEMKRLQNFERLRAGEEAKLQLVEAEYARLRQEAINSYGTDDPEKLRLQADEIVAKAEASVLDFSTRLDDIQNSLAGFGYGT